MRRGAVGRGLRPSGAPTLVLSSTPPPYALRQPAHASNASELQAVCPWRRQQQEMLSEARCPVPAVAVPRRLNTVHVALRWARGHSNSGQPVAAQALAPRPTKLPLLGSNQDSPDPESGVLPVTPRGRDAHRQDSLIISALVAGLQNGDVNSSPLADTRRLGDSC